MGIIHRGEGECTTIQGREVRPLATSHWGGEGGGVDGRYERNQGSDYNFQKEGPHSTSLLWVGVVVK